jgi:hypothetical protein
MQAIEANLLYSQSLLVKFNTVVAFVQFVFVKGSLSYRYGSQRKD